MTKMIDHDTMDLALNDIADNGDFLHLCSAAPSVYADVATLSLGFIALTPGVGNGVYTLEDGIISGRRLNVAQQIVPGTAPGTATHAVIIDSANSKVKALTACPNYTMSIGSNQSVPAYNAWEIENPT